mgnify:CR=1 FL=1
MTGHTRYCHQDSSYEISSENLIYKYMMEVVVLMPLLFLYPPICFNPEFLCLEFEIIETGVHSCFLHVFVCRLGWKANATVCSNLIKGITKGGGNNLSHQRINL